MIVTYLPAAAEPREWTFRPMEVSSREAELVEEYLAVTYAMWVKAFQTGSIKAQRVALWLLLRRDDPTLPLESVDYQVRELRCRFEGSEAHEMRLQVQDDPDLDDEERARLLARIDLALDEETRRRGDTADDDDEDADDPKDTAPAAGAGSGESPTS
jgi:hypothetical protein